MKEKFWIFVEDGREGRDDHLGDREVTDGAVVVVLVECFQDGVGEGVV